MSELINCYVIASINVWNTINMKADWKNINEQAYLLSERLVSLGIVGGQLMAPEHHGTIVL